MKKENDEKSIEEVDEIGKILQQKYDDVVVPEEMFDTTKVFEKYDSEKKRKKNIIKVASVVVIILVVGLAIGVRISLKNMNQENVVDNTGEIVEDIPEETEPEISGDINLMLGYLELANQNLEFFYTTQIEEILDYEIIDGVPSTRVRAHVLKDYLNDEEGDVEMIVPGGVFTVKEIKSLEELVERSKVDLSNYTDDQKVNVTCYNEIYIPMAEVGKTYLTSLSMKDGELYVCTDVPYGFKEYDEESNTIKDKDGNSIAVDIDSYLSSKK